MAFFLFVYISVYGAMQLYIVFWLRRAWPDARWLLPVGLVGAAAMVAAPIVVNILKHRGVTLPAQALSLFVYTWFAWSFWFLAAGVGADLWGLALRAASRFAPGAAVWVPGPRAALSGIGAAILLASVWGLVEAARPRLETVRLTIDRLPPDYQPVRVVQITDLHQGLIRRTGVLRRTLELVREARPDVIVSTGDLIDAPPDHLRREIEWLAGLEAPLGKYAVFGNHEVYLGRARSREFHDRVGFRLVHGEAVDVGGGRLVVAGVTEPFGPAGRRALEMDEKIPLDRQRPDCPVLLLKHRPVVAGDSVGRFDLQLSGHTHAGQIFPFGWVVRLFHMYSEGLSGVGRGSWIYVSRGSGSWGPPMRLLAPPEVTLIILEPAAENQ